MPSVRRFDLRCRRCSETGELYLLVGDRVDWSFVPVGFIGVAIDRHTPERSVLRCIGCRSERVEMTPRAE